MVDKYRVQRVDGLDKNIKGIQLKRMVDRIRRFQVFASIISLLLSNVLFFFLLGSEQSDLCNSEQIFENFLQRDRKHASGACEVLPATNPPGRALTPVETGIDTLDVVVAVVDRGR